ncbi:MAG TPA: hypothetical protein VNH20_08870 [Candidatus Dormibacteraeota bacterium]|nr:hypothetical protein [Candidatus Dormibacteraeota bacterium]HVC40060.1 hypothetical protein [Candidatus Dormibacteraeota bacterium]
MPRELEGGANVAHPTRANPRNPAMTPTVTLDPHVQGIGIGPP